MGEGLRSITCTTMHIHFCRDFLMYVRFGSNLFFDSRDLRRDILVDISFGNITSSIVNIGESCMNLFLDCGGSLSFNSNRSLLTLGHGGSTRQGDNGQEDKELHDDSSSTPM